MRFEAEAANKMLSESSILNKSSYLQCKELLDNFAHDYLHPKTVSVLGSNASSLSVASNLILELRTMMQKQQKALALSSVVKLIKRKLLTSLESEILESESSLLVQYSGFFLALKNAPTEQFGELLQNQEALISKALGTCLISSDELIEENFPLVDRLANASKFGWMLHFWPRTQRVPGKFNARERRIPGCYKFQHSRGSIRNTRR